MMRGCACKPVAILQDFPVVKAQEPRFTELPCLMWPSPLGRAIPRCPGHTGAAVPFPGSVWLSVCHLIALHWTQPGGLYHLLGRGMQSLARAGYRELLHVLGDPQHPYQVSINHGKPTSPNKPGFDS